MVLGTYTWWCSWQSCEFCAHGTRIYIHMLCACKCNERLGTSLVWFQPFKAQLFTPDMRINQILSIYSCCDRNATEQGPQAPKLDQENRWFHILVSYCYRDQGITRETKGLHGRPRDYTGDQGITRETKGLHRRPRDCTGDQGITRETKGLHRRPRVYTYTV